ncbi:Thymidylate kinase [Rahnella aquatilis]|nr:Thymidylate kinase [Rahnella aquatilis]
MTIMLKKINTEPTEDEAKEASSCIQGLIAVVGSDGTGKSTLTADLVRNLQKKRVTERRYLGLVSGEDGDKIKRLPVIGVWLERRLAAKSDKTQRMSNKPPALWAALIMYGFSLWRASNLQKVIRLAQSGVLVISDRYPQAEISGFYYDGPGIGVERAKGWLMSRLAERERRLYQQMALVRPQLILRLDIDVDTAYARKPDHSYEELEDKISAMVRIQYNGSRIIELDARAPYDEVLAKALDSITAVAAGSAS